MILTFLPLVVCALQQARPSESASTASLQLSSHAGEDFVPATRTGALPATFVLPFTTRSERVVRILPGRNGLGIRFDVPLGEAQIDRLRAVFVPHGTDEELLVSGGELYRVGPPRLPRTARAADQDVTPLLARRDGVAVAAAGLSLEPSSDLPRHAHLVLSAADAEGPEVGRVDVLAADGTRHGGELVSGQGQALLLDLVAHAEQGLRFETTDDVWLDRVAFCRARPLARDDTPLPLRPKTALRRSIARRTKTRHLGRGVELSVPQADARNPETIGFPSTSDSSLLLDGGSLVEFWFEAPLVDAVSGSVVLYVEGELRPSERKKRGGRTRLPVRPLFEDVGASLEHVHLEGPDEQLDIRPTMGPGAAWGDVDGDGWNDLYLVQGGGREETAPLPNRLFANRKGKLVDQTEASGAGDTGAGMGALFFDADSDGDLDLYVANYGRDALLQNDGSGRFRDVSSQAGLSEELWSAAAVAADPDVDGDLDVYVTSYLDYDTSKMPDAAELGRYRREDPIEMLPFAFPGQRNVYLRNVTDAQADAPRFEDATEELGLDDVLGRGMQATFWDFDHDGDQDLYIANDVSYNVLFRNEGDGTFKDVSFATGMDDPRGGMGIAVGDLERDGDLDLVLTNWELEANAVYRNNAVSARSLRHRVATFRDVTVPAGLGPYGVGFTSWGAELFDADNDGDLDLFVANGYTSPDYESTGICIGQPNQYFENDGEGRFDEASATAGPALAAQLPSRCALACDYDQDGGLDLVVTANNAPTQLLHNVARDRGHWLGVRLRASRGNRFGIGARVTVRTPDDELSAELRAGRSYLGGNAPELHFGLGRQTTVEELRVHWPDGTRSTHPVPAIDRFVTLDKP